MKKLLRCLLFTGILAVITGCGADLIVTTEIRPDGSGTRTFEIVVPDDQMGEVIGGQEALTAAIAEGMMDGTELETEDAEGKTVYRYKYEFSTIDQLNEQMSKLSIDSPPIEFEVEGTAFSKIYRFKDSTTPRQYMRFVGDAVVDAGIIKDEHLNNLVNSEQSYVLLPGSEEPRSISAWIDEVSSERVVPVKSVAVITDLSNDDVYTRTITVTVDQAVHEQLEAEREGLAASYLEQLSEIAQVNVIEDDGLVHYEARLESEQFDELASKSNPYINNEGSIWEQVGDSKFFPRMRFSEDVDLSPLLGSWVRAEDGYTYTLRFKGKQVSASGVEVIGEDGKPKRNEMVISQTSPYFRVSVYTERTSPLYYAVVIGGSVLGAGVLALVLILVIRNRRAIADYIRSARLAAEASRRQSGSVKQTSIGYCHNCGHGVQEFDIYCHSCGGRIERELERGA